MSLGDATTNEDDFLFLVLVTLVMGSRTSTRKTFTRGEELVEDYGDGGKGWLTDACSICPGEERTSAFWMT